MLVQQFHGVHDLFERTFPATAVVLLGEAFDGEGQRQVADLQHLLAEFLIDQGAVGEGEEFAVGILFAETDDVVLADHRLSTGEQVEIDAELLALFDDGG